MMDKEELKRNLKYLIKKYVDDEKKREELLLELDSFVAAKYFLVEIDSNMRTTYDIQDLDLIQDIDYYYI